MKEKFNNKGIRYAIRNAFDKNAKVYYFNSLVEISQVTKITLADINELFLYHAEEYFTCKVPRLCKEMVIVKREYKYDENSFIDNIVLEKKDLKEKMLTELEDEIREEVKKELKEEIKKTKTQDELKKEICDLLFQYFRLDRYSEDASKNRVKKVVDLFLK